jgi:heparan-alpha-glucosaminide N-acetyltransferase
VAHAASIDQPAVVLSRIQSIDALRGFVMFLMIFVNDLAGAGRVVPDSMVHFSDRHNGGSGMTFVDLVFPAFLFIVGMSIPLAFGRRLGKGQSPREILPHVVIRTLSLMAIGILMVHETPDTAALGWSGDWWCVLMYLSAIAAFCSISPLASAGESRRRTWRIFNLALRSAGFLALVWLALVFRGPQGRRIISIAPFSIDTSWYGILGLIGWAYLVASVVFLIFRQNRTAILGCMALLMCLFAADRGGLFEGFWLNRIVGIGGTLGSHAAIAAGGLLVGAMIASSDFTSLGARTKFICWFVAGCAAAALLLNRTYGISKNSATPSWCFWASAITAMLWYAFHLVVDVRQIRSISRPLVLAGQNVLLAYLISEMLPGLLDALGLSDGYGRLAATLPSAVARSTVCGVGILVISASLNRIGFRLKL